MNVREVCERQICGVTVGRPITNRYVLSVSVLTLICSFSSTQLQLPKQNPELMGVASRFPNKSCMHTSHASQPD